MTLHSFRHTLDDWFCSQGTRRERRRHRRDARLEPPEAPCLLSATPRLLKIGIATRDSTLSFLTNVGNVCYFTDDDGVNGRELWKTAGSVLIKDIYAGASGASPSNLTNVNDTLFFTFSPVLRRLRLRGQSFSSRRHRLWSSECGASWTAARNP